MVEHIPTNIVSGFLGVGKTTFIQRLLAAKPEHERWAILVNEFGEVGIDGSIYKGQKNTDIFVREVPGGCMCCTAGLPMQIALNQLLSLSKPDRLIIEPTGLGHLNEVLASLSEEHYQDVLDLKSVITLVDARKLQDQRYTSNDTFQQQIQLADVIAAAKTDLYSADNLAQLAEYVKQIGDKPVLTASVDAGELWPYLNTASQFRLKTHAHGHQKDPLPPVVTAPEQGFLSVDNEGEGYVSRGWVFNPDTVFDRNKLLSLFHEQHILRLKGVFISEDGVFVVNKSEDALTVYEIDDAIDSRFEIISEQKAGWDSFERALLASVAQQGM